MTRYMLSVHSVEGEAREPMSAEDMQRSWQQVGILEAEMQSTGAWVFSGRLHEADTATVVRVANGELLFRTKDYDRAGVVFSEILEEFAGTPSGIDVGPPA